MRTISGMLRSVHGIMGIQGYQEGKRYKRSIYRMDLGVEDGWLLYNTWTRELVHLSNGEYASMDGKVTAQLVRHWFLVPEEVDERSMYHLFWQQYQARYPRDRFGKLALCTVLTTTACNARCPYCYQAGAETRTMSSQVAADVAGYIRDHCARTVQLKWFGGEPLCNAGAIRIISQQLKDSGVDYFSSIVTNGLLLDNHRAEEIQGLWRLKWAQVTLDGTEDNYNRIKGFAGEGNAFRRVMGNIGYLLDLGVDVTVRLNLSQENSVDLFALTDELGGRFSGYNNLQVYCHPLFEGLGVPPFKLTEEGRVGLYGAYEELSSRIRKLGIGRLGSNPPYVRRSHCMADDGRSTVILPGGELALCEHHLDDERYGSIYNAGQYDQDVLARWAERAIERPECASCAFFPQCIRLRHCPTESESGCTAEERWYRVRQAEAMMLGMYKKGGQA